MASADRDGKKWRARWRTPSGSTVARRGFPTKRDAMRYTTEQEAWRGGHAYADDTRLKVADAWARYRAEVPKRPTTMARDQAVMKVWWLPPLGERRLRSLEPATVRTVVTAMADKLRPPP